MALAGSSLDQSVEFGRHHASSITRLWRTCIAPVSESSGTYLISEFYDTPPQRVSNVIDIFPGGISYGRWIVDRTRSFLRRVGWSHSLKPARWLPQWADSGAHPTVSGLLLANTPVNVISQTVTVTPVVSRSLKFLNLPFGRVRPINSRAAIMAPTETIRAPTV